MQCMLSFHIVLTDCEGRNSVIVPFLQNNLTILQCVLHSIKKSVVIAVQYVNSGARNLSRILSVSCKSILDQYAIPIVLFSICSMISTIETVVLFHDCFVKTNQ